MKPRLLDTFAGAGGCSVGYARAGFDVVGVDVEDHPDYPYELIVADAMDALADRTFLDQFDVIHASPPCQAYSSLNTLHRDAVRADLVAPVRELLQAWGGTYVIENVPGAPLHDPALFCGAAFGLGTVCRDGVYRQLQRHRLFESNVWLMSPGCACDGSQKVGVYGNGGGVQVTRGYMAVRAEARAAMGIDWMRHEDIVQAIPPAYTHHIGAQLIEALSVSPSAVG